ncbi:spore coat U domain-containing protein [Sphingomonas solaris]|uniref:Spore coat protein U domain-containing protein n=1 Tax=Alterirhizorhabdus solaris TaxID=2529389 RepID=A0A558QYR4_9SPHN|nr:spore coat protein U domain-containing protein [Sphingomonas solaris]TVV72249.1 spore coat protein U domain-containing protein [Sphingomonas solaris]
MRLSPARRGLIVAAGCAGLAGPAAAVTSQSFQVGATVVQGCVVATSGAGRWGSIDFGTVSGVAQGTMDADLLSGGAGGISIECTPGIAVSMSADAGDHAAGGVRRLATASGPGVPIPYQLFLDGGATAWTTQAVALPFAAGVSKRVVAVRGRATLVRPMAAGVYADTVRVTLSW